MSRCFDSLVVHVRLRAHILCSANIGSVVGDEVLQLYFSTSAVPETDPAATLIKELFDFERYTLQPGNSTTVAFTVSADTFITYDAEGNQVLYPGLYTVTATNGVYLVRALPLFVSCARDSNGLIAEPDGLGAACWRFPRRRYVSVRTPLLSPCVHAPHLHLNV